MTCFYSLYVVLIWLTVTLSLPAALASAAVYFSLKSIQDNTQLFVLLPLLTVALTFWTIFMRTHSQRVMIRAGAWPAWCMGDITPTVTRDPTSDELQDLRTKVRRVVQKTGKPPTIVGSGWGFFLKRSGPHGPRLFTHRFRGQMPSDPKRWACGTTLNEIRKHFEQRDKAFSSLPTMDYIALGTYFGHGNHGNRGNSGVGKSGTLVDARVLNMRDDTVFRVTEYKKIRELFDSEDAADFLIVDCEIRPSHSNIDVQKMGIEIRDVDGSAKWLAPGAYMRVLFVGAARDYGLGLRWQEIYDRENTHRDPHLCSQLCQITQADYFSAILGWHEPMNKWNGTITMSNATKWTPPIFPLEMLSAVLLGVTNFEIIFFPPAPLTPKMFWVMVQTMIEMHKETGGRSEFRTGGAGAKIYMDVSLMSSFHRPFEELHKLGVRKCSLHPGKYSALPTSPLRRRTLTQLSNEHQPSATV